MATHAQTREIELRDYVDVLRRRKWLIALVIVLICGFVFAYSATRTPQYRASSQLLLRQRASEQIFAPQAGSETLFNFVNTEIEVMQSQTVRDAVAAELGRPASVSISPVEETDVVVISATSTDPEAAAEEANVYASTYVTKRREALVNDLLSAAEEVQKKVDEISAEVDVVEAPLVELDARIAAETDPDVVFLLRDDRANLVSEITDQRAALSSRLSTYEEQLDQLQLARELTLTGGAQIVSNAEVSNSPFYPTPRRNLIVGFALSLLLAIGLAFLVDHFDDTINSKEDLDSASGDSDVLATIPLYGAWRGRGGTPTIASVAAPASATSEGYRTLRTSLQFIGIERRNSIIQVTSPNSSEGKSTTIANLAIALARANQKVVLIDCDLRRPRIHEFFGLDNDTGFTGVLLGQTSLAEALQSGQFERNLAVLPSGAPPPNPSELLSSAHVESLIQRLDAEVDFVLIDSPPVLPVTDAIVLSRVVDATIVVIAADHTTKRDTARAFDLLRQVDAPVVGTVLNGVDLSSPYSYKYGGYGYNSAYSMHGGHQSKRRLFAMRSKRRDTRTARIPELPTGDPDEQFADRLP